MTQSPTLTFRQMAVGALGLFGALHWGTMVRPAASGALLTMLVVAVAVGLAIPVLLGADRGTVRGLGPVAVVVAALGAILLAAGVPLSALRPDHWDTLVVDLTDGVATLPALRMPYGGADAWVRAVLLIAGGLLLLLATIVALLPRPRTFDAAVVFGVLYGVAIVEHPPGQPYFDGALFALLLGALLCADRLHEREAPMAIVVALASVVAVALVAPHVDANRPWVDYEALAESLQAGKSDTFAWNHDYAPLRWPRDGRELARVRSRGELYLKTAALEVFRNGTWSQSREVVGGGDDTEYASGHPEWTQTIHVTIKGLRSEQFLGAGTTTLISRSTKAVGAATPGTFEVTERPLRRGDSYDAQVYVPTPSTTALRRAGVVYPDFVGRQLTVSVPNASPRVPGPVDLTFPAWGNNLAPTARSAGGSPFVDVREALAASGYGREYDLAQQLRAASTDPYDYVQKVMARVQRDARYTESPPPPGRLPPLDAFLFRDHAGYCQHFAGATALLLRMGGVPARVAAGFAPGSRSGNEQLIRDLDAHSWVEAYFPHYGWITFDPTPSDSPARSQQTDLQTSAAPPRAPARPSTAAGDRLSDPTAGGAADTTTGGGGDHTLTLMLGGAVIALTAAGAVMAVRRRRRLMRSGDPDLEELRLALVRCGRAPTPDVTLARLERLLDGSDGALGYLRALRLERYGSGSPPPTPAQRRALRRELGAGLGIGGRLRSLWALPPRPREVLESLNLRRRRAYTA